MLLYGGETQNATISKELKNITEKTMIERFIVIMTTQLTKNFKGEEG